jgi:hypothetical protein
MHVDIHEKYGDIVRFGPNELSFADPKAVCDIYGSVEVLGRVEPIPARHESEYRLTPIGVV